MFPLIKEVSRVNLHRRRSPPRPSQIPLSTLDRLWSILTSEQRQRTLTTLSGVVLRQLDAPQDETEVRDERF